MCKSFRVEDAYLRVVSSCSASCDCGSGGNSAGLSVAVGSWQSISTDTVIFGTDIDNTPRMVYFLQY